MPKESVQLSIELTGMIQSAQVAHLALLDQYVAQRRERVDEFMQKIWIPKFMDNAIKDTKLMDLLSAAKDNKEKEALVKEFQEDASVKIDERRSTLLNAIYEIEAKLREAISGHSQSGFDRPSSVCRGCE